MSNRFSLAATAESRVATPAINRATGLFALLAGVGICAGLYAFYAGHHNVYNNTREMPWGILISSYAFFAITSTGLCLLAYFGYVPSVAELLVTMAGIGIVGAGFLLGERFFGRAFDDHGAH